MGEEYDYLFLFGAGASYRSQTDISIPLGKQLYARLEYFEPQYWRRFKSSFEKYKIINRDTGALEGFDFESGFQEVRKILKEDQCRIGVLQKSMARFFLNFTPTKDNVYRQFLEIIQGSKLNICMASLNYDLLLQQCMTKIFKKLELILPHGSAGLCSANEIVLAGHSDLDVLENITDSSFVDNHCYGFKPIVSCNVEELKQLYNPYPDFCEVPIMSYYAPDKKNVYGYGTIVEERQKYDEAVTRSKKIVIMGVMPPSVGNAVDTHLWSALKGKELIFVNPTRHDIEKMEAWCHENNSTLTAFEKTFIAFLGDVRCLS
jgi:hypothetical protein